MAGLMGGTQKMPRSPTPMAMDSIGRLCLISFCELPSSHGIGFYLSPFQCCAGEDIVVVVVTGDPAAAF